MKKDIRYFFLLGLPALLLSSCYSFEEEPLNLNTEERVLNPADSTDNSAVKRLFYACYLNLPSSYSYIDASTDDGMTSTRGVLDYYRNGLLSPASLPDNPFSSCYTGIRYVNVFLSKVDIFPPSAQVPASYIKQMKAESRLLRAFYYFELLKRWGGVPLIGDKVFGVGDNLNIPRSSIQEVADYIEQEISPDVETSCYADLHAAQSVANDQDPANQSNMIGHVNQGVALALLSRLSLYLASPLYNESSDIQKWAKSASWSKRLIDLGVYKLRTPPAGQFAMTASNFPNPEMIMVNEVASPSASLEIANSPTGFTYQTSTGLVSTKGTYSPSQNLADAFLTLEGKSIFVNYDPEQGIDPASGYDPQKPYNSRDPRLARTLFVNDSRWLGQTVEIFEGGKNRGATKGVTYTRTGYYLKKFCGEANETASSLSDSYYHHSQLFRYGEILLNYAEAVNESDPGNDAEITKGLILLRQRAGIRAGDDGRYGLPTAYDQTLMRRIIQNERRIELAFEEHRMWDIRRWKIAEDVMNKPVRGVVIAKNDDGTFTYNYVDVSASSFRTPRDYWYPIPRAEMLGNSAMEQNPDWGY
jgi:hypothetical protein